MMTGLQNFPHHKAVEDITEILVLKTGNNEESKPFFRIITCYFLAKMASSMNISINTNFMGNIPVNMYAIALATSGFGKGNSVNTIEEMFLEGFKNRFLKEVFPEIADKNLWKIAMSNAVLSGKAEDDEKQLLDKEFERLGPPNFTFDSGSVPATKQLRDKFLLADIGSINLQIDEIGSNLSTNLELLTCFLELFDKGQIKQKLTKQSNENKRTLDLSGKTPANVLLFGTPSKLFDGSKTENEFYSVLETGYARRCFFAFGSRPKVKEVLSARETYQKLTNVKNANLTNHWAYHFENLADPSKHKFELDLPEDVGIELIEYKQACEAKADSLSEYDDIEKAELAHRYFKALKLAGVFAFIDESSEITSDNLKQGIKITEESGKCFDKILSREANYVKLAKYISSKDELLTHADLHEALPFYKESTPKRKEMIALATSWGYKNCVIIKQEFVDGIEFFSGESLKETNQDELMLSVSNRFPEDPEIENFSRNFEPNHVELTSLEMLSSTDQYSWCNHFFVDNHRKDDKLCLGFNCVVLDVDNEHLEDENNTLEPVTINKVKTCLEDISYFLYTTKRHTNDVNRFRVVIPMKYILELSKDDYKKFMDNIQEWLPFSFDEGSKQRSKKWLTHISDYSFLNEKDLFDPIPFIPKTSRNSEMKEQMSKLSSLSSVEKFFALEISKKRNRNNNLSKYAFMLKDTGHDYNSVESLLKSFNKKLSDPLSEEELSQTILRSLAQKYVN